MVKDCGKSNMNAFEMHFFNIQKNNAEAIPLYPADSQSFVKYKGVKPIVFF